jgi:hypothetical protein
MGSIIRMNSKEFIKGFLPAEKNADDFQYVLVSERITTTGELKNAKAFPRLIPPGPIVREFIDGDKKAYKKVYLKYLQEINIEAFVSIIVKSVIENDFKIVLICSKSEDEFKYLKYLCEYIEAVYKLKTHTLETYLKNPDKANKIKNKDEVRKIIGKKFDKMNKTGINLDSPAVQKKEVVKELKKLGRKELKRLAKSKNIKLDKEMSDGEMAKKIAKKLLA